MIKPIEHKLLGVGYAPEIWQDMGVPLEDVATLIATTARAVNMLIEEHNVLVRIRKGVNGPVIPHDVEYEWKDPNETT